MGMLSAEIPKLNLAQAMSAACRPGGIRGLEDPGNSLGLLISVLG
jgi:hypothetical protein